MSRKDLTPGTPVKVLDDDYGDYEGIITEVLASQYVITGDFDLERITFKDRVKPL